MKTQIPAIKISQHPTSLKYAGRVDVGGTRIYSAMKDCELDVLYQLAYMLVDVVNELKGRCLVGTDEVKNIVDVLP